MDDELEQKAATLGLEHGHSVGSWVTDGNTTREMYAHLLAGLEEGDPEVMDMIPSPLSGEWVGDPTPASVLEELGVEDDDLGRWDYLLDAYEMGFRAGWEDEVTRACLYHLEDES